MSCIIATNIGIRSMYNMTFSWYFLNFFLDKRPFQKTLKQSKNPYLTLQNIFKIIYLFM